MASPDDIKKALAERQRAERPVTPPSQPAVPTPAPSLPTFPVRDFSGMRFEDFPTTPPEISGRVGGFTPIVDFQNPEVQLQVSQLPTVARPIQTFPEAGPRGFVSTTPRDIPRIEPDPEERGVLGTAMDVLSAIPEVVGPRIFQNVPITAGGVTSAASARIDPESERIAGQLLTGQGDLSTQQGIRELARRHSERPLGEQIALGIVADPLNVLDVPLLGNLAQEVIKVTASNPAVRRAITAHVAIPAAQAGNRFVAPLRDMRSVMSEVVTSDNPVVRAIVGKTGINPSILSDTDVGKAVVAYHRQSVAAEELTQVAVSAALDPHAQRWTGRLGGVIPIDQNTGFLRGFDRPWQDVFSRPDDFNLSDATRSYVDDFLQTIDEVEQARVAAGLKPRAQQGPEGWFYVPRQVRGIRSVELRRPSRPELQRHYEEALEGFANGIRYDVDPRATLELHVRQAYREIAEKQLSDVLEPFSVTARELVRPEIVARMESAISARKATERAVRSEIAQARRDLARPANTPGQVAARKRDMARLERLRNVEGPARIEAVRKEYDAAKRAYGKALEAAKKAEIAPGNLFGRPDETIAVGQWRSRFFPQEDYEKLRDGLGLFGSNNQRPSIPFQLVQNTGNMVRFLSAVGDFAMPFIQGLPVLARNPVVWGKMALRHYQAFFDPTVQGRLIRDKLLIFQDMARHGVPIGDPEFFAAMQRGQGIPAGKLVEFLPKGEEARRLLQQGGKQSFGRFQASYNAGLGSARALMWEALAPRKLTVDFTRGTTTGTTEITVGAWKGTKPELAQYIRNLTGGLDSRALGVPPNQRAVESVWLAFSPRLLRSTVALIGDALNPTTPQGKEALRTLAQLASGVTATYVVSGLALGKSWEEIEGGLDPLNGKRFLAHNINGDWIGVGGQVRAISQFMAKSVTTLAEGDFGDFLSADQFDNPLVGFYMSRGAPAINVVGGLTEALTGGRIDVLPFDNIDSLPTLARHLGESSLPFAVQGILEGESAMTTAFGLAGARTSPATPAEIRDEARRQVMREKGIEPDFRNFNQDVAADVRRIVDADPRVAAAIEQVEESQRLRNDDYRAYRDAQEALKAEFDTKIQGIAGYLSGGTDIEGTAYGGRRFREDLQGHLKVRAARLKQLEINHADALKFLEELEPSEEAFNVALTDYYDALYGEGKPPLEDPITGDFDFDEYDRRLAEWRERHTADIATRVEQHVVADDPKIVNEIRQARDALRPYFEVRDSILERVPELRPAYEEWEAADPRFRNVVVAKHPQLKALFNTERILKENMRMADEGLERLLLRWGYITSPMNPAVRAENLREGVQAVMGQ